MRECVCFDDVLLVPQSSDIKSRTSVDLTVDLSSVTTLGIPFISSPMDTVTGQRMASAMAKAGGLGVIHRYNSIEEQVALFKESGCSPAAALGVTSDFLKRAAMLHEAGCRKMC